MVLPKPMQRDAVIKSSIFHLVVQGYICVHPIIPFLLSRLCMVLIRGEGVGSR